MVLVSHYYPMLYPNQWIIAYRVGVPFGGSLPHQIWSRSSTTHAGYIDEQAWLSGLFEVWDDGSRAEMYLLDVNATDLLPLLVGKINGGLSLVQHTGVVDYYIEVII